MKKSTTFIPQTILILFIITCAIIPNIGFTQVNLVQKSDFGELANFSLYAQGKLVNNNSFKQTGFIGVNGLLQGNHNSQDSVITDETILTNIENKISTITEDFAVHRTFELPLTIIEDQMEITPGGYYFDGNLEIPDGYTIYLTSTDTNAVYLFNVNGDLTYNDNIKILLQGGGG